MSLLKAKEALVEVFTSAEGKESFQTAMSSNAYMQKKIKQIVAIIIRPSFFEDLDRHLNFLLPH